MIEKLKLFPPATNYFHQLEALFRKDPDVTAKFDRETNAISLYVNGQAKADALDKLLFHEVDFGNEKVTVKVIPANEEDTLADLYRDAFAGNPAVTLIHVSEGPVLAGATYVLFEPEVVQYKNDDIGDLNGIHSTLYQYLAEKAFENRDGVFFNTAPASYELETPLGEWP